MKHTVLIAGIAGLYAAFVRWYTGHRTPLTAAEVEQYMQKLNGKGAEPEVIDRMRTFLEHDSGRDFVMVNLIKLNEQPTPVEGIPSTESSMARLNRYNVGFLLPLLKRAGHPILAGQIAAEAVDLWGIPGGAQWTIAGLVRYRSRRDMIEAATAPSFRDLYPLKHSAIEKTIAVPADPWFHLGDPRLIGGLLALIAMLLANRTTRRRR